jgi:4-hydroxybenzoate polyprenyltransferase
VLKKAFDLFVFSSLYISLCALLMVDQTSRLLHIPAQPGLLGFVFFSTICSYNFHWYLTPRSVTPSQRVDWTQSHRGLHAILYLAGLAGSVFFFFRLWQHWLALVFGALITFLYSAPKLDLFSPLRKIAVGKTIFLSFVWMYVTSILPVWITGTAWKSEETLYAISRFSLIYSICILFDYRDREDDKLNGIKSMIIYFNDRGIRRLFILSLLVFALSTVLLNYFLHSPVLVSILLLPGLLLALLYNYARRNFSDYLYYFVLDGLMMLSGLIMFIFSF